MTTKRINASEQPNQRIRREIESACAMPTSWPETIAPEDASQVRSYIKATVRDILQILDELQAQAMAASDAASSAALTEIVQQAQTWWIQDSKVISGADSWDRITIWAALCVNYLSHLSDQGWPQSIRERLKKADETLLQWLSPSLATEVRSRVDQTKSILPATTVPALTRLQAQPRITISVDMKGRLAFIGLGSDFRGGSEIELETASLRPESHEHDPRRYDVWFATDRTIGDLSRPSKAFGNERDPDGRIHYGSCSVEVPQAHKFGSTGSSWWKRWARFEFRDDHLRLVEVLPFEDSDEFFNELREQMLQLDTTERQALIYLHGYNVSFEEAAIRAAQIGFDLKVPGVTAFFSWPSTSDTKSYFADQDRIEASESNIANFLTRMARDSGASTVHILAHSMGNRGLARAVQRITVKAAQAGDIRFGQIILAAPDISVELFRDLALVYPKIAQRTTMYASAKDRALAMSGFLQDGFRAGFTPPITVVSGIDTIEVTDVDVTILGHGYYAAAEAVLYDMSQLLQTGIAPAHRPRLRAVQCEDGDYWRIGS